MKLTLESFVSFSLSLIWSYFPLAPQCLQTYLSGRNLYHVLEDVLFYLLSGFEILLMSFCCEIGHFLVIFFFIFPEAQKRGFKRCWNGSRMALNKTKSEQFSCGFTTNPIGGAYSALRRSILRKILSKLLNCQARSEVLQLQIVLIRFRKEK